MIGNNFFHDAIKKAALVKVDIAVDFRRVAVFDKSEISQKRADIRNGRAVARMKCFSISFVGKGWIHQVFDGFGSGNEKRIDERQGLFQTRNSRHIEGGKNGNDAVKVVDGFEVNKNSKIHCIQFGASRGFGVKEEHGSEPVGEAIETSHH